jgi:hypothetical protein
MSFFYCGGKTPFDKLRTVIWERTFYFITDKKTEGVDSPSETGTGHRSIMNEAGFVKAWAGRTLPVRTSLQD